MLCEKRKKKTDSIQLKQELKFSENMQEKLWRLSKLEFFESLQVWSVKMLHLLDMTAQKVSSTRVRELLHLLETKNSNSTEAWVALDRLDSHNIRNVGWRIVITIAIVHQNYVILTSLYFLNGCIESSCIFHTHTVDYIKNVLIIHSFSHVK